jgi:thermitase
MRSLILTALLILATQANAAEFLVKYRNLKGLAEIQNLEALKSSEMQIVDHHEPGSYVVVNFEQAEGVALAELMTNPDIEWITENGTFHTFQVPVAPISLKEQWAIAKVGAAKAWERAGNRGDRKVIVAVIDTGVDYRHQALSPNMVAGYDFAGKDNDPMDETSSGGRFRMGGNKGHGTHCAGVIGSTGLVDGGTIGISPNVSIMPVRSMNSKGAGDFNDSAKAIDYAVEHGAQVISASWGGRVGKFHARAVIEAVERASAKGVIFVVAAGNSGENNDKVDVFPANATTENTISVAASNSDDLKPDFSNFGKEKVHVAAPGFAIMSTLPKDTYESLSGTSMATPMVAGLVALLKAQDPSLTGPQIRALIQMTGAPAAIETACNCRIDAFKAIDHLISKKPWLVPMAFSSEVGGTQSITMMNAVGAVTYAPIDPTIASVNEQGLVQFLSAGTTRIRATDSSGQTVETFDVTVRGAVAAPEPAKCPYSSERLCKWTCRLMPSKPFCRKAP